MPFRYNTTGIETGGNFLPAPAGSYNLIIKDTKEKTSKSGFPMVNCKCEIDDTGEWLGTLVWHNVTFLPKDNKGAGMSVQFLKAIGQPWDGDVEINPSDWVNCTFKAKLKVEKDLQGRDRNAIAYLITEEKSDDEVPF